jgi:hypothetical protein
MILHHKKRDMAKQPCVLLAQANLAGKSVINVTNPIADLPPANGVLRFHQT